MKNSALKPQFVSQYVGILKTFLARGIGDRFLTQKYVADSNAKIASRVTIRARLEELAAAGVLIRRDHPVSYRMGDMSALDALTDTKTAAQPVIERKDLTADENAVLIVFKTRKSRDRRGWTYATMATAVDSYWQAKDGLDGLVAKGLVSKSAPLLGNARRFNLVEETASAAAPFVESWELNEQEEEICDRVRTEFDGRLCTNYLSFEHLYQLAGYNCREQMASVLEIMIAEGELIKSRKNGRIRNENFRKSDTMRMPRAKEQTVVEPVPVEPDQPYPFLDRVADFLASADKPWQSAGRIAETFGTDAEMIDNAMLDIRAGKDDRFQWRHTPVPGKRFSVWCYALRSRVPVVPVSPVEAPQSAEKPVEAPAPVEAPVEAPTPSLTLRDIIEQAVAQAVELTRRENEARIAELTADRDRLRDLADTAQARFAATQSYMMSMRELAMNTPL